MSIATTVQESLNNAGLSQYQNHAAPVVEALVTREREISEGIISAGVSAGLSADTVKSALADLGVEVTPAPEVAQANGATIGQTVDAGVASALAQIQRTLDSLSQFARSNGYRG